MIGKKFLRIAFHLAVILGITGCSPALRWVRYESYGPSEAPGWMIGTIRISLVALLRDGNQKRSKPEYPCFGAFAGSKDTQEVALDGSGIAILRAEGEERVSVVWLTCRGRSELGGGPYRRRLSGVEVKISSEPSFTYFGDVEIQWTVGFSPPEDYHDAPIRLLQFLILTVGGWMGFAIDDGNGTLEIVSVSDRLEELEAYLPWLREQPVTKRLIEPKRRIFGAKG